MSDIVKVFAELMVERLKIISQNVTLVCNAKREIIEMRINRMEEKESNHPSELSS